MAFIFIASSIPQPPDVATWLPDKLAHGLLYAGLGGLLVRGLTGGWTRPVTLRVALAAVAIATLYGVTDEIHQSFVPKRNVDVFDVVADFAGAAASGALARWGIIRPNPRRSSRDLS
jgi:VanZ family protein